MATGFIGTGGDGTRVFGLDPATRAGRFARAAGLVAGEGTDGTIVADLGYGWDPAWLGWLKTRPGTAVTIAGFPALVHRRAGATLDVPADAEIRRVEDGTSLYNATLRKRDDAYLMPLTPATAPAVERASYDASYKGVTDLLTLYLWRGTAFHLTRAAAALRLSPTMVTTIGLALCVWATLLFYRGHFLAGLIVGLVFMVLDTVDGKLARCTGTSSKFGHLLDHGTDLIHPPIWYWAWGIGLTAWDLAFAPGVLWTILGLLVVGYVVQRLIEGAFIGAFGMHIHVWRLADSRFRLVTARRNPNWLVLLASVIAGRPDWGLIAVLAWTIASCLFHLVRLAQAFAARARGAEIVSWLA
ncbi:CDP-alcohol phosphatidyltransferase family protein [Sphingomonas sp.]|uniref:CDP-alcohol phosphatidyltransferase family protein n=1 Tax=Sphingomonas sp. TaxID=28214 RepID=UPI003AFFF35C